MRTIDNVRVHFHGNQGLANGRSEGARYDYVEDPLTGRKDAIALVLGNRPKGNKLVRGSKALFAVDGAELPMRHGKVMLATPVLEKIEGGERWMLDTYNDKVVDIVLGRSGLDWEQGDTGNHKQRLEAKGGPGLWPHGIVPYDIYLIEMVKQESADLFLELVKAEPRLALPKRSSDVQLISALMKGKRWLPTIECPDYGLGAYRVGPRGIYYTLYVDGRISQTRRNAQGELDEVFMGSQMRKMVENLLRKQQERDRQAAIALADAAKEAKKERRVLAAAVAAGDMDEAVRDDNLRASERPE